MVGRYLRSRVVMSCENCHLIGMVIEISNSTFQVGTYPPRYRTYLVNGQLSELRIYR